MIRHAAVEMYLLASPSGLDLVKSGSGVLANVGITGSGVGAAEAGASEEQDMVTLRLSDANAVVGRMKTGLMLRVIALRRVDNSRERRAELTNMDGGQREANGLEMSQRVG